MGKINRQQNLEKGTNKQSSETIICKKKIKIQVYNFKY